MALRGERKDKPSYAILRSLKGGKTGDVYEVDHKVFGRKCVQKTYSTLGLEDAIAHQEPRLLHTLEHPHIAEVLEAQYDPEIADSITFVSIYYEGGSIADAFDEGYVFSLHQTIGVTIQILDALSYVHGHSDTPVIHRDVKPGNVFLDGPRTHARLGDWGSAAPIEAEGDVAAIEGSPLYTPPEGGPIDGRIDVTGDLYSAGLTAFEMVNGPFDYANIDPTVVDQRLSRGQRALPESAYVFAPHVPPNLRSIIRRSVRANPRERYQSASQFIGALRGVRCIDWTHVEGTGLDGVWEGTWPPNLAVERRRRYQVRSSILRSGPHAGQRRLEALQAPSATARFSRFGVEDATVDPDDRGAVERFFAAVSAKAAQRAPAR
jgi:eukaryotic-like serine/threonine-protein kinase